MRLHRYIRVDVNARSRTEETGAMTSVPTWGSWRRDYSSCYASIAVRYEIAIIVIVIIQCLCCCTLTLTSHLSPPVLELYWHSCCEWIYIPNFNILRLISFLSRWRIVWQDSSTDTNHWPLCVHHSSCPADPLFLEIFLKGASPGRLWSSFLSLSSFCYPCHRSKCWPLLW